MFKAAMTNSWDKTEYETRGRANDRIGRNNVVNPSQANARFYNKLLDSIQLVPLL